MDVIVTKRNLRDRPVAAREGNGHGAPEARAPAPPRPAPARQDAPDAPLDRLLKLVPAEVVAGYTALLALATSIDDASAKYANVFAMCACSALLILAISRAGKMHDPPLAPPLLQYVFSLLAFWAWACSIRDPLQAFGYMLPPWIPAFACVLVPTFGVLVIDMLDGPRERRA
jgi:hypothetical protein